MNYFGEKYESENCGACDACLEPAEKFDGTQIAQKILSAVIRTNQQFGGGYISRLLLGQNDKRLKQFGHDRLSVYGIVNNYSREQLNRLIDQLTINGLLQKTAGQYPILRITEQGLKFLKQQSHLDLYQPRVANQSGHKIVDADMEYDRELFDKLRAVRKQLAADLNVPPYVIFSDKSLQEMTSHFPQSAQSFKKIFGVGEQKLDRFGKTFLSVISAYAISKNLPDNLIGDIPKVIIKDSLQNTTYDYTKELLLKKLSLAEIVKKRGLKIGTIIEHLEKISESDNGLPIDHLKPNAIRLEKIKAAFETTGMIWALGPVRELLGDDYSYDELRLARIFIKKSIS